MRLDWRAVRLAMALALVPFMAACEAANGLADRPDRADGEAALGVMTSLPLLFPLGGDFAAVTRGTSEVPWLGESLGRVFDIRALDTLSEIAAIDPDKPSTDPLAGLDRLVIIQPRGLSPADNVALDDWVRAGGHLLLALDPALSGHYDVAIGDPRHPSVTALIPPVVARWGLRMRFDPDQPRESRAAAFPGGSIPLLLAGEFVALKAGQQGDGCSILAEGAMARCTIGTGRVTLLADAAVFEHDRGSGHAQGRSEGVNAQTGAGDHYAGDHGEQAEALEALLAYAFAE